MNCAFSRVGLGVQLTLGQNAYGAGPRRGQQPLAFRSCTTTNLCAAASISEKSAAPWLSGVWCTRQPHFRKERHAPPNWVAIIFEKSSRATCESTTPSLSSACWGQRKHQPLAPPQAWGGPTNTPFLSPACWEPAKTPTLAPTSSLGRANQYTFPFLRLLGASEDSNPCPRPELRAGQPIHLSFPPQQGAQRHQRHRPFPPSEGSGEPTTALLSSRTRDSFPPPAQKQSFPPRPAVWAASQQPTGQRPHWGTGQPAAWPNGQR